MGLELEFTLSNENISSSNNAFIVLPTSTEPFIEHRMRQIMETFNLKPSSKSDSDEGKCKSLKIFYSPKIP